MFVSFSFFILLSLELCWGSISAFLHPLIVAASRLYAWQNLVREIHCGITNCGIYIYFKVDCMLQELNEIFLCGL